MNGVAREEQFTWVWVGTESDLPLLKVGETQYEVELRQREAKVEGGLPVLLTILRTLRTATDIPVDEIILEFQDM
jgi:hypothetical protein